MISLAPWIPAKARELWNRVILSFTMVQRVLILLSLGLILAGPVLFPGQVAWIDRYLIDLTQRGGSFVRSPSADLFIVTIDEDSLKKMGASWPLPRSLQAEILEKIGAENPKMIICDILYQHPESNALDNGDATLASTIRRLGKVGLISLLEPSETRQGFQILHFSSLKDIRHAASFEGFVWAWIDSDDLYRSFVVTEDRIGLKSIAAEVAERVNPQVRLPSSGEDRISRSLVSFSRGGGGIPTLSASDVLTGQCPPGAFRDKIVLLGVSAEKQRDYHLTTLGEISGTLFLAYSIDTLISDRVVECPSHWSWFLIMSLLGGAGGFWMFFHQGFFSLKGGITALSSSILLFLVAGICVHVLPPLGSFVASWVSMTLVFWALTTFFDILEIQNIHHEANVVGELQRRFFPEGALVSRHGYECLGLCLPCDKAGGDFYDYFEWPDQSAFFMIADVSGHGFAAGLITSMAKALVTRFRQENMQDLESMVDDLNTTLLTSLQKAKMMTAILGRLLPEENKIVLKFAGHLPAYHVKPGGKVVEIGIPGFPLGSMKRKVPQAKVAEIVMAKGDMLVMLTDGVIEAIDWNNKQFTFDTWKEFLAEACESRTIPEFFEKTLERVRSHTQGRPFGDDVSLLVIRRLPAMDGQYPKSSTDGPETHMPSMAFSGHTPHRGDRTPLEGM